MAGTSRTIRTLDELRSFAAELVTELAPGDVVTLSGELGVGKTAFVKAAAAAFGVSDEVISPTFIYEQRYPLPQPRGGIERLIHLDLYRLGSGADVADLGLELHDPRGIVFIEWPERVSALSASHALTFTLEPDGRRTITIGEKT